MLKLESTFNIRSQTKKTRIGCTIAASDGDDYSIPSTPSLVRMQLCRKEVWPKKTALRALKSSTRIYSENCPVRYAGATREESFFFFLLGSHQPHPSSFSLVVPRGAKAGWRLYILISLSWAKLSRGSHWCTVVDTNNSLPIISPPLENLQTLYRGTLYRGFTMPNLVSSYSWTT